MRPFLLVGSATFWTADLEKSGLMVSKIGIPLLPRIDWFVRAIEEVSKAGSVVVSTTDPTPGIPYLTGVANGLGIQVIGVGRGELADILRTNPRNVCYDDFEQAVERYFSSGRAAQGKEALR